MQQILEELNKKRDKIKIKLDKRRLDIGDQDTFVVSRYVTATRWMVEQEIESLDKELNRIDKGIREVRKLLNEKNRYRGNYFITDEFECLELGIISTKSEMGKSMFNRVHPR